MGGYGSRLENTDDHLRREINTSVNTVTDSGLSSHLTTRLLVTTLTLTRVLYKAQLRESAMAYQLRRYSSSSASTSILGT